MDKYLEIVSNIKENVSKIIMGKENKILTILKGVIAGGHILIEDVPGVGKTTIIKALTKSMDLNYKRVQFTPDLLPTDILGVSIYNQKTTDFEYKRGPVFTNILLADEINRAAAKTQSALLEAMEEKQVSEGNSTYRLPEPFTVLATQNPLDHEGTYELPQAQLDRFIIKISLGYPTKHNEIEILKNNINYENIDRLTPAASLAEIMELQEAVHKIKVHDSIYNYIIEIVQKTREWSNIEIGSSTRGALALMKIAQASALIEGRDYVIPEDVKDNAVITLAHRIVLNREGKIRQLSREEVIEDILKTINVPKER